MNSVKGTRLMKAGYKWFCLESWAFRRQLSFLMILINFCI